MSTAIVIEGQPLAVFTFPQLPSWNTILGKHWRVQGDIAKEQRTEGRLLARSWMNRFGPRRGVLIDKRVFVVVRVYLKSDALMDIHNVCVKNVLDGFTDSQVWPDDEWAYMPLVLFALGGIDPSNPRIDIEVHSIDKFVMNGKVVPLPDQGRIVNDGTT